MDVSGDNNQTVFINNVKYLQELSNCIPHEFSVLKSFYSTKFHILQERANIHIKSDKGRENQRCSRCCLKLTDGPATYRIDPNKNSKFANKLLRRKLQRHRELWTNYQACYLKRLNILSGNSLVATCKFCTKENVTLLPKPIKKKEEKIVQKVKKPKKKKDKSCGLNISGVQPIKPQLSNDIKQDKTNVNNRIIKKKGDYTKKRQRLKEISKLLTNSKKTERPVNQLARFLQSLK